MIDYTLDKDLFPPPQAAYYQQFESSTLPCEQTYYVPKEKNGRRLIADRTITQNAEIANDSSTEDLPPAHLLSAKIAKVFSDAVESEFEDGMESDFSRALVALISEYGEQAIKELSGFIQSKSTSPEAAGEALRWIGRIYSPSTFQYRFWLLTNSLGSKSARVRDGALLGLAFLDSTKSIPYLARAIDIETSAGLKDDMQKLLQYLGSRRGGKTVTRDS